MRRDTKIEGHLLGSLMAQTAFETFSLGYSQALDRCPRGLVDHVYPHVGQPSILRASTNSACLVPHPPVPARRPRKEEAGTKLRRPVVPQDRVLSAICPVARGSRPSG